MALLEQEQDLIERWIEQQPHRSDPAEARLVEFGIPVWALVGYLEAVGNDVAQVAADYEGRARPWKRPWPTIDSIAR